MNGKAGEIEYRMIEGIKKIRKDNGMTQERFAEEIGFSATHYARVEKHRRNLSLDVVFGVMMRFELSFDDLLDDADKHLHSGGIDERIKRLPDTEREAVLKAVNGVISAFENKA